MTATTRRLRCRTVTQRRTRSGGRPLGRSGYRRVTWSGRASPGPAPELLRRSRVPGERRPRSLREVVFVDGVRTPFGKAGPKGIYAETRADDLVVRVHPRAAAPQPGAAGRPGRRGGHRRHDPDRRPGPDPRADRRAAGGAAEVRARLLDRPHVRRRDDRRDHHRQRHRLRRLRRRHRRRCRAHGPPPDGRGRRPEPAHHQREDRRPVGAGHGLDGGEPARPLPAPDQGARRRLRAGQPAEVRQGRRQRADRPRAGHHGHPLGRARLGRRHRRRAAAPADHPRGPRLAEDAVPPARPRDRRQRRGPQRRRHRLPAGRRGRRARSSG